MGDTFCAQSLNHVCLLVGAFNPFTFKVITDKYDPVKQLLLESVTLGSVLSSNSGRGKGGTDE